MHWLAESRNTANKMITSGSYDFVRELVYQQLQVPVYTQATYATQDVQMPVIVFRRTNTFSNQTMNGAGIYFDRIVFSIKAKTVEKVEEIRDFLIALLDAYNAQFSLAGESNTFDLNTAIYTRDIIFNVIYSNNS